MNDPKCDHLIRWSPNGASFLVLDEDEFSKALIPDLFKHNNYTSFVRQLNMYGFHKVVGLSAGSLKTSEQRSKPPSEYRNQYFVRGMPDLMWLIQKPVKRNKGKKIEDSDEDGGSDGEAGNSNELADGHLQSMSLILKELEEVREDQVQMSNTITSLRNQLNKQSIAFQTLHDRHESSISAILTFLATVYDSPNAGQMMANIGRAGVVETGSGQPRTPFKRRKLMLPPVPHANGEVSGDDASAWDEFSLIGE